jgi:hypothetical protein
MISIRINVEKIDKKRLFKGEQGTYLDCVLIETPNSEYADYMVVESISKEERAAGQKGTVLGNAKNLKREQPPAESLPPENVQKIPAKIEDQEETDLPF